MNKIALFKKMISENQVYLWMVLLTLALGVFSYFNADFFFPSEIKEIWKEKIAQWESLSSDEFVKKLEKNLPLSYLLKITFLLGFIFLIFGLYLSFLFFSSLVRGRISFSTQDFPQVNWQVSDIFRAVIIIFFLINIVKVSLSVFFQFFEPNLTRLSWQFLIQAFLIDLFSLGVIFYFVHKKHLSPFTQLGLRWENLINNLLVAFFHYIGLVPLLFLAVILSFSFTT
ncbi:MAG: hypothetical protein NC920_05645, partial [Candidatus Omnitrophica bacterium]|nr:hypothetical protein [Candidatus Omnitrophota bacterium]